MPTASASVALLIGATQSGGTSTSFNLTQRSAGSPTIWSRNNAASGSQVGTETISYSYSVAKSNAIINLNGRLPTVVVDTTTGLDVVAKTCAYDIKLTVPKNASTAERTRLVQVLQAHVYALAQGVINGEAYF